MKTVFVLAALVAAALAGSLPVEYREEFIPVDAAFVDRQKKIFDLFYNVNQINADAEYYKVGKDYDIEANLVNYTNQKAVQEFFFYYRRGMLPWREVFSVFNEKQRDQAIALYNLFYYAKDFDTFYKTAAWARVHMNDGLFVYSFTVAIVQRPDTRGIILPPPYEVYPYYFLNADVIGKMHTVKMYNGKYDPELAKNYGVYQKGNINYFTANYSGAFAYDNEEYKLSYFTEDIGLNSYYYYYHTQCPFWINPDDFYGPLVRGHGRGYFIFHKNLLARYYMERLTNGLGEIPQFSWKWPVKTGYSPNMIHHSMTPFVQRDNNYYLNNEDNNKHLQFIDAYENQFIQFLEQGRFKAYNMDIDLWDVKSDNFVGNYWQSNYDLHRNFGEDGRRDYEQYYDVIARLLLGGNVKTTDKSTALPIALQQHATSLRDPVFWQFYKHILYYFVQYHKYIEPYSKKELLFDGVKINNVVADKLETFFDYYEFNATNAVDYSYDELKSLPYSFVVRQPRLNQKKFNINIEVKSEVAADAIVKIFLAPKYDSRGIEIPLEDNWVNFFELDKFSYKLKNGINNIVRSSDEFFYFAKDFLSSSHDVYKWLDKGKVPTTMSLKYGFLPKRLMLPKGTPGGYPFQFFVVVYPYSPIGPELEFAKMYLFDNKPSGYPLDRKVNDYYQFFQSNMFFKDTKIYHTGEESVYKLGVPNFENKYNFVQKA